MDSQPFVIIFEALYPDVVPPERATSGAAGYDVRAHLKERTIEVMVGSQNTHISVTGDSLILQPGIRAAIPLGFRATLPAGIEAQVRLRSSTAFRKGLMMPNAPATIDPDYPDEWLVLVTNPLSEPIAIKHLERIAQIVFARFEIVAWQHGHVAVSTNRGEKFGSTGA